MSTVPVPASTPVPDRRKQILTAIAAILAFGGWVVSAVQALRNGEPIPAPPVTIVADAGAQAVRADDLSTPLNYEGCRYHGAEGHDNIEANGRPFPGKDIRYHIDYSTVAQLRPALSKDAVSAALRQSWNWWSEQLDISPQETTDPGQAHFLISFNRSVFGTRDGALGVLAACEMGDGTARQKRLVFDAAERWLAGPPSDGGVSIPTVGCHEIGHGLGLGHDDATAPAVMRPMYTKLIPREQARDIDRMVGLGYARRDKVAPGATDVLSFPVQAKTDDVIQSLEKAGFKVTKP